jgi:hypothetical protein
VQLVKREGLQGDSGLLKALKDLIEVCRYSANGKILAQASESEKAVLKAEGRK